MVGFIIGINICPQFLPAFTRASATGTLSGSMLFFAMFFWGTSVYGFMMIMNGAGIEMFDFDPMRF